MARQEKEIAINKGPSKLDLMLSLFDTDMGKRIVKFYQKRYGGGQHGFWIYDVQIISARRRNPGATIWEIEGITDAQGEETRVSIYYLSDTREGTMWFENKLETLAVWETPDDTKKMNALMEVIFKMIHRYRESHPRSLDKEIFRLFEKAKRIHYAENRDSLDEVI